MPVQYSTGWRADPDLVDAFKERLDAEGGHSPFAAKPSLLGTWDRLQKAGVTAVFSFEAERKLTGAYLPPYCQATRGNHRAGFGWCVGAGGCRAAQRQHWGEIAAGVVVAKPVELAWEFTYAVARQRGIRAGRLGGGDGAYGGDYAYTAHDVGFLQRGVYQTSQGVIDLSKERPDLGWNWSQPGARIPQELFDAAKPHTCRMMFCDQSAERNDILAAGKCSAMASYTAWGRGRDGMFYPAGRTAHQEHAIGICRGRDGRTIRIRCNSHCGKEGKAVVKFQPDAAHPTGESELPLGAYPVYADDEDGTLGRGTEYWAFDFNNGWRPGSLTEFVKQGGGTA